MVELLFSSFISWPKRWHKQYLARVGFLKKVNNLEKIKFLAIQGTNPCINEFFNIFSLEKSKR